MNSRENRLQRISIDAGFGCPNRDGRVGHGGCIFCSNEAFTPAYLRLGQASISQQIDSGIAFYRQRGKGSHNDGYAAYFQAYSGTYAPIEVLRRSYYEAVEHPAVKELIVATRPDCVDDEVLRLLKEIDGRCPVTVELGVESCYDRTLQLMNRCHTFAQSQSAARLVAAYGLRCGIHMMIGLPGESEEDVLNEVGLINQLPIEFVKFHQLQILRGTELARMVESGEMGVRQFALEEYVALMRRVLDRLRPDIHVERYAASVPPAYLSPAHRSWQDSRGRSPRSSELKRMIEDKTK